MTAANLEHARNYLQRLQEPVEIVDAAVLDRAAAVILQGGDLP